MTTTSAAWRNAINGKMYGRRCAWCGALLVRKRVKSGEYESAANFKRRMHCNAEHAALAMRSRGLAGIAEAMMRRSELHAES